MKQSISSSVSMVIPVAIGSIGFVSMIFIAKGLELEIIPLWPISADRLLNITFTMQMMLLPISLVAIVLLYLYNPTGFKTFFRFRSGLKNTSTDLQDNWKVLGPVLAIAFTLGTTMYMSVSVTAQHGQVNATFFTLVPWVLLFAATNAWTEEIFTRLVIVAGLYDKLNPVVICWISAIIFGAPHFFGTPNGILGVIFAGLMGWLLAKSVIETRGLGWALFIHFLQDVVIFGGGAMVMAGK